MAKIAQLCEGWASWLAEHFPAALNTFQQGASADEITAFEHEIGFKLPDDVRAWFGWRDGQLRFPDCNILFGFEVLSIDAAVEEWKDWQ